MKRNSIHLNIKRWLVVVFVSTIFLTSFLTQVSAQSTTVSLEPSTIQIDQVGEISTVNVTVTNVTDLFTWQFRLYFDSTVVTATNESAWYPTNHVFAGKTHVPVAPVVDVDANGTYIQFGCTLMFIGDEFTGDGILCQINFTGIAEGFSNLTFGPIPAKTFLLNPDLVDIPFEATDGEITVIPEYSTLTITMSLVILTLVVTLITTKRLSNRRISHTQVTE